MRSSHWVNDAAPSVAYVGDAENGILRFEPVPGMYGFDYAAFFYQDTEQQHGRFVVYDAAERNVLCVTGAEEMTQPPAMHGSFPDRNLLAYATNQAIVVYRLEENGCVRHRVISTGTGTPNYLRISKNGRYVFASLSDRSVTMFDVATAQPAVTLRGWPVSASYIVDVPPSRIVIENQRGLYAYDFPHLNFTDDDVGNGQIEREWIAQALGGASSGFPDILCDNEQQELVGSGRITVQPACGGG